MKPEIAHSGGARPGRDRPHGSSSRRTADLVDRTLSQGDDPAEALLRIAEEAEATGDLALAIDTWKGLLPYVYARPKPVQIEPDTIVALVKRLEETKREVKDEPERDPETDAMLLWIAEGLGICTPEMREALSPPS